MKISWLGRIGYDEALALQEEIVAAKLAEPGRDEELLLLEHEPIYTIGRNPDQSSLRNRGELPYPVVQTGRGGQATYHGPGQLMAYPILDLRLRGQDLHRYLRALETLVIKSLESVGVVGVRRDGLTGVWVRERKIASIGVGVRRWITMHGFSLNVCGDLEPFEHITPCGISGIKMTSVEAETKMPITVEAMAGRVGQLFSTIEDLCPGLTQT